MIISNIQHHLIILKLFFHCSMICLYVIIEILSQYFAGILSAQHNMIINKFKSYIEYWNKTGTYLKNEL